MLIWSKNIKILCKFASIETSDVTLSFLAHLFLF